MYMSALRIAVIVIFIYIERALYSDRVPLRVALDHGVLLRVALDHGVLLRVALDHGVLRVALDQSCLTVH